MNRTRVVVLLPVYNREEYLPSTLRALENQTFRDFVVIAIDDRSTDSSWALLSAIAEKEPGRWLVSQNDANLGAPANMNRCLAIQRERFPDAEYIVKVDSDDLIGPDVLETGVRILDEDPEACFCHFRAWLVKGGQVSDTAESAFAEKLAGFGWSRKHSHRMPSREALRMFIRLDNIVASSSGAMIRRRTLESLPWPWFDPGFHLEDYEFWTRLAAVGAVRYVADVNVHVRQVPDSRQFSKPRDLRVREVFRIAVLAYLNNWRVLGLGRCISLLPIVLWRAWGARACLRSDSGNLCRTRRIGTASFPETAHGLAARRGPRADG